jgi:hypothetical protein
MTNILASIWGPTRLRAASNPVSVGAATAMALIIMPAKLVGRTVTLGLGVAILNAALQALANTPVGADWGIKTLVARLSSSLALSHTNIVIGIVALGVLSSFLIEKYVP